MVYRGADIHQSSYLPLSNRRLPGEPWLASSTSVAHPLVPGFLCAGHSSCHPTNSIRARSKHKALNPASAFLHLPPDSKRKQCCSPQGVLLPSRGAAPLKGCCSPQAVLLPSRGVAPLKVCCSPQGVLLSSRGAAPLKGCCSPQGVSLPSRSVVPSCRISDDSWHTGTSISFLRSHIVHHERMMSHGSITAQS